MDEDDNNITIEENGIAWETDIEKYKNAANDYKSKQWIEIEGNGIKPLFAISKISNDFLKIEHLMVWMRLAGFSSFKKLWGRIEDDLDKGEYKVVIQNSNISFHFFLFFTLYTFFYFDFFTLLDLFLCFLIFEYFTF